MQNDNSIAHNSVGSVDFNLRRKTQHGKSCLEKNSKDRGKDNEHLFIGYGQEKPFTEVEQSVLLE